MNNKFTLLIVIFTILTLPLMILGRVGVGVGTGKIQMDEPLRPGSIYEIPSVVVRNTGDEPSNYQIAVEGKMDVVEMIPDSKWINFEPKKFYLEPGESELVQVKIILPVKGVKPGDYFAFLSASPIQELEQGMTSIGVAAATKLYFLLFQLISFKDLLSFISLY